MGNQIPNIGQDARPRGACHHHDAACPKHLNCVGWVSKTDAAVATGSRLDAQADIVGHAQLAITAIERQVTKGDIARGLQQHVGVLCLQVRHRHGVATDVPGGAAHLDGDRGRVQQQITRMAVLGQRIRAPLVHQVLLAGHLGQATVARHIAATDVDLPGEGRAVIGPEDRTPPITALLCARIHAHALVDLHGRGIRKAPILALVAAAHMDAAAPITPGSIQGSLVLQTDVLPNDADLAARALRCRGVQRATCDHSPGFIAPIEHNAAALCAQASRFDDTAGVDDLAHQRICTAGAQGDHPAIGLDVPLVLNQGVHGGAVHAHAQQIVATQAQGDGLPSCQGHMTLSRLKGARVAHLRGQQGDVATLRRETPLVHHLATRTPLEGVAPGQEIRITQRQG